jgi:poly(A) polymerase
MTAAEQLAQSIVHRLQSAGHVAYYAGGCVRDRLMNCEPKDFDVATSATPDQVFKLFPRSQQVGAAFGVILVRQKNAGSFTQVEVATFRSDGTYSDGRHPDSVRFTTAEEDARRRDFTCNGLFFDPLANNGNGQLHDFIGGQQDIANKTLRAIGDPAARFAEDHLRMLRAIRFAARLDFTIDPTTLQALQHQSEKIRTISKERIHDELARILEHPTRTIAAELLQSSGLLAHLWPRELYDKPEIKRKWFELPRLPEDADFVVSLIALHDDIIFCEEVNSAAPPPGAAKTGGAIAELLRRDLLLNNVETADLAWLMDQRTTIANWQQQDNARLKRLLADPRWPRLFMLYLTLGRPEEDHRALEGRVAALQAEGAAPAPFITGETLIKLGAAPGPKFKQWLEDLYNRQLNNEFPTQQEALTAAKQLLTDAH